MTRRERRQASPALVVTWECLGEIPLELVSETMP
jgi:hypothetical protein